MIKWTCALQPCEHTFNMTQQKDTPNHQDKLYSLWLVDNARDKRNTCDRLLNDCDDACATVHTNSCVSAMDVYIENTTCTHEVGPCAWS